MLVVCSFSGGWIKYRYRLGGGN